MMSTEWVWRGCFTQIHDITMVAGNARINLCYCGTCGVSNVNITWSSHDKFPWAVRLCCNNCQSNWTICTVCTSLRSQLSDYKVSRHDNLKHKVAEQPGGEEEEERNVMADMPPFMDGVDEFFEVVDGHVEEAEVLLSPIVPETIMEGYKMSKMLSLLSFGNPNSDYFFKHDIQNPLGGGGASALVTRAISGADDSPTMVHPNDVSFHLSISKFVRLLSRNEQVAFANIILLSEDVVKNRF